MSRGWKIEKNGEGKVLVRMEKESGRTPRTKYFISICPPEVPDHEYTSPEERPQGFHVPALGTRGSSDRLKPYVPTPGDVRRMFGSDKIDAKPEYISSADPDWSKYKPESREEVQRKIRIWKEATSKAEKDFEDRLPAKSIAEFVCNRAAADLSPRNEEERNTSEQREILESQDEETNKSSIESGILINPALGRTYKRKDKRVVIVEPTKDESEESIEKENSANCDTSPVTKPETNTEEHQCRIARMDSIYNPKTKKSRKSLETAVDIVKKMNHAHWKTIDNIYYILKTKQSINFQYLSEQMTKIVKHIYGIKTHRNVLTRIDKDRATAVIKLSKLLLNLYQEASYENIAKGEKFVSLYNRSPKTKIIKNSKVKLNADNKCIRTKATKESTRINRCEACVVKKQNLKHQEKKKNTKYTRTTENKNGFKNERRAKIIQKKITAGNISADEKTPSDTDVQEERANEAVDDPEKGRPYSSPPDLGQSSPEEAGAGGDAVETSPQTLEEQVVLLDQDNQTPEKNYLLNLENSLFTLFASSEDTQSVNDLLKPDLVRYDANEYSKEYFNTTLNLFWLNEKLEDDLRMQMKAEEENEDLSDYEECDSSSTIIVPRITEVENEDSQDLSAVKLGLAKAPLCSKLLSIANECTLNRNYISIFVSVMLGIAAAYFSKDEEFSKDKLSLKNGLKSYLRTFLLGALRLVNEI